MYKQIRKRIYEILDVAKEGDTVSRIFDFSILFLIVLNVLAVILATEKSISNIYGLFFKDFETISVIIFTCEYLLRIWSCVENSEVNNPITGRLKFALSFLLIVDLFAILPFYLPFLIPIDLRFIRIFRLLRVFRVIKLARYTSAMTIIMTVLRKKMAELLITAFIFFMLWVISASLIYYAENGMQPESFSSIPAAMWWSIVTLTTVGYGDIVPVTFYGKFIAVFVSIIGIGFFALPTGIIGSGFMAELDKSETIECPNCGKKIKIGDR